MLAVGEANVREKHFLLVRDDIKLGLLLKAA